MRNQPKYNFLNNTGYALSGFKDVILNETSFKIEMFISLILFPILIFIDMELTNKLLMLISLMGMLIAEVINSAIERVVDLVTIEFNPMAGRAKDVGSTIVLLSILSFIIIWGSILLEYFKLL